MGFPMLQTVDVKSRQAFDLAPHELLHSTCLLYKSFTLGITEDKTCQLCPLVVMEKTVLNLSRTVLTEDQMSVLSKGLNFCPTPNDPDPGQYKIDLDSLHGRLRLRTRFTDPEEPVIYNGMQGYDYLHSEPFQHRKFRPTSTFNPVGPPTLEAMNMISMGDQCSRRAGKRT
jgi:hypothetical protein